MEKPYCWEASLVTDNILEGCFEEAEAHLGWRNIESGYLTTID
jgi:hypothetical protein